MEQSRFPNKLKMFRRCQGYSQKKVARILGLKDTSTLSRWEHDISFPSLTHVFALAQIYHAQPFELFDALWNHAVSEHSLLAPIDEPFSSNQSL